MWHKMRKMRYLLTYTGHTKHLKFPKKFSMKCDLAEHNVVKLLISNRTFLNNSKNEGRFGWIRFQMGPI